MSPTGDWDLIDRYLANECSEEEVAKVEQLLESDSRLAAVVAALRSSLEQERRPAPRESWDIDRASARLARTAAELVERRPPMSAALRILRPGSQRVHRFRLDEPSPLRWRSVAGAAAAVIVLAAGSVVLWTKGHEFSPPAIARSAIREISAGRGERAAFNLADGSKVILAAESRLLVPADYGDPAAGPRVVDLDGQAWFQVRHDSLRPFEVHTKAGVARDLGTEFVVSAYPEGKVMRVIVAEGAVAIGVTSNAPLMTLRAGDLATLDTAGVATLTRDSDLAPFFAWKDGTLAFDGASLRDVLSELSRWYDLDLRLADASLADRVLTATFTDEAAPQVVDRIARVLHLEARWDGHRVTLSTVRQVHTP